MSDEAVTVILRAAAPGHLDAVADSLSKLAPQSFSKTSSKILAKLKEEQKVFQCLDGSANKASHPLAGPLTAKLEQYQQDNFANKQGVQARMSIQNGNTSKELIIHTYAERIDAPNQLSGYWRATWTLSNITSDSVDMSGRVQIHSYAYEEGNAQATLDKILDQTHVVKSAPKKDEEPTLLYSIMKQIMEWELHVLGLLQAMNEGGTGEHLKAIRRVLPITKTKMKWDVVAQRSVKTLKKTAPSAKSKVNYGS